MNIESNIYKKKIELITNKMMNQITKSRPKKSFFDLNLSNSKSFHSEIKK